MKFGEIYELKEYGECGCGRSMKWLKSVGDSKINFYCECGEMYSTVDPKSKKKE